MQSDVRYLIPNRLAFVSATAWQIDELRVDFEGRNACFISSDLHQKYVPLAADFGPVNLGIVHRFCSGFQKRVLAGDDQLIVYCISECFEDRANASFLLGAFMMLCRGWTAEEAAAPFTCSTAPFTLRPFRDATFNVPCYELSLLDCLHGLARAVSHGWFDLTKFDSQLYWELDNPMNGDLHQYCPKFVAMKGPLSRDSRYLETDEIALAPEMYVATLGRLGVTCVVRLNEPDTYDKTAFERAGIAHHDLYFDDCTAPPDAVVERFLDICDREGTVAVHCRAGLGRTGTLVALWLMKHAGFGADEAMGWLRIVRPGSVLGPQQEYLKACEARPWRGNTLAPPDAAAPEQVAAAAASRTTAAHVTAGMVARGAARAAAAAAAPQHATVSAVADSCRPGAQAAAAGGALCPAMVEAAASSQPPFLRRAFRAVAVAATCAASSAASAAASVAASAASAAVALSTSGATAGGSELSGGVRERALPAVHAWVRRGSWRAPPAARRRRHW